jgi:hypothetical protein
MAKPRLYPDGEPVIAFPQGNVAAAMAERLIRPQRDFRPVVVEQLPTNWKDALGEPPSVEGSHSVAIDKDENGTLYGRITTLIANHPGIVAYDLPQQNAIWTPMRKKPTMWTVTIAVDNVPLRTDNSAPNGQLKAYIQYMLGGIPFTKTVFITSTTPRRFPVQGRQIQVNVSWEGISPVLLDVNPKTVNFSVACEEGEYPTIEYYSPRWVRNPPSPGGVLLDKYLVFTGQGMLMSAFGYLTAFGAGDVRYYPMFFDYTGGPPPTTPAIMVGQPLVAVNQGFSFDDEFSPQVPFSKGLYVALSSTDIVYTAPGAGAQWRCDCKLGT